MIILSIIDLALSFGVNDIFSDVSFDLKRGKRIGLIGSNGSGKTSLLKIICGELEKTSGNIRKNSSVSINYLSQLSDYTSTLSVWQDAISVYDDVFELESKLREIEHQMSDETADLDRLAKQYTKLTTEFEDLGGYSAERMTRSVLAGLGIDKSFYERKVNTLSGGQRARVQLAMALLRDPDVLLLDEPTNHLDLNATKWLEIFLSKSKITLIVVSHDRYFLDNVCSDIIELSMGKITLYKNCNYSEYMIEKEARWEQQQKLFKANQAEIKRHEAVIRRYRSWTTEKAMVTAKSWEKRLAKLEVIDKPISEKLIKFRFDIDVRSGSDVLRCKNLSKSFDDNTIFENVNLHIRNGDKIALMGPNGVGKTTLLKIIAGTLKPNEGESLIGSGIQMGYYDQHQQNLKDNNTAQDEIWDAYHELTPQQVRDTLALFLFTGDDIEKEISVLSGGERGRLSLLKLMLSNANFLLLDEPTNHLDMDSRQVLESALYDFPGTVLFVSHDRYFINSIANKILDMTPNGITSYEGSWDDYQYHLSLNYEDSITTKESKTERSKRYREQRSTQNGLKQLKMQLDIVEKNIFDCEIKKAKAEKRLSSTGDLNTIDISTYSRQYDNCERELESLMHEWEDISSKIDKII
ncbi:MAG: ABC-F family ATP-binding cassette domain-containing protein [Clostridiales bacterium]|nr:ABC-F family ATP-binding cassette domain-containing protein [Clostridiales bacterium]